jgi:prepilin-type processing-associated H-X9-DG protein
MNTSAAAAKLVARAWIRDLFPKASSSTRGFTVVELLSVLSVLAALALVLTPAFARTKPAAQSIQCLANHQQLMRANAMYQSDCRESFPAIYHGSYTPPDTRSFAAGWLDWDTRPDNTNRAYLFDSRYASLAFYLDRKRNVYKCPADTFTSAPQRSRGWTERVRSVSANVYVGEGNAWSIRASGPNNLNIYNGAAKTYDLTIPGPAWTWVYLDQHPDSINDSAFFAPNSATNLPDLPATYHNLGAGFAMADGHSEMHRWVGTALKSKWSGVRFFSFGSSAFQRGDPDLRWLSYGAPRRTDRTVAD